MLRSSPSASIASATRADWDRQVSLAWMHGARVLACVAPCPPRVGELQPCLLHSVERTHVSPLLWAHSPFLAVSYSLVVPAEELAADGGIATVWSSTTVALPSASDQAKPRVVFLIIHWSFGVSSPSSTNPNTPPPLTSWASFCGGVRGPSATVHRSRSRGRRQVHLCWSRLLATSPSFPLLLVSPKPNTIVLFFSLFCKTRTRASGLNRGKGKGFSTNYHRLIVIVSEDLEARFTFD
jgi:hypothetical protein